MKILFFLFMALVLAFSLRGLPGNPTSTELFTPHWMDNGPFELSPERGRYGITYALIEDNVHSFSVPLARFIMPDLGIAQGRYVSIFAPGVSYLTVPGFLLGRSVGAAQVGVYGVIALFALLNSLLVYHLAAKLGTSAPAAALAALIFLFATPAFAYGVNLYQHHISTFLILSSLSLAVLPANGWRLALIWFLAASSIPIDYPNLFLMLPICLYSLHQLIQVERKRGKVRVAINLSRALTILTVLLPLSFFLWFNQVTYGNPWQFSGTVASVDGIDAEGRPTQAPLDNTQAESSSSSQAARAKSAVAFFETRKFINGFYIHLISPDRGILYFTPVLLLALLGIPLLFRRHQTTTIMLIGIIVTNLLLYSMWGDPWGGWAFGSRYLVPSYAILAIFLAVCLERYRRHLLILGLFLALGGFSLYVNAAGALSTSTNPPQVQVLGLEKLSGRRERYSFDRNLEYLQAGRSKSYVYQTYLSSRLSAWEYYQIVSGALAGALALGTLALYLTSRQRRGIT